jgi:hypothetical protein
MPRLERAHIEAWDGGSEKAVGAEDLLSLDSGLRFGLKSHIQLLAVRFPIDESRLTRQRTYQVTSASENDCECLGRIRKVTYQRQAIEKPCVMASTSANTPGTMFRSEPAGGEIPPSKQTTKALRHRNPGTGATLDRRISDDELAK